MKFKRRFYRKFKYNRKRSFMFIFFFLLCLSFGLGYSLISTDLNIFGTTVLKDNRWDVHFDNIQEIEDSVSPTVEPEITDDTTVSFSAKLKNPGDKFEFLIDVVNDGTIDAKIGSISMSPTLTEEQQNYFSYEVTYENDLELSEEHALDAGTSETLKVAFKYLEQEDDSLYPMSDQTFNVTLTIDYVQGTGEKVISPYLYDVLKNEADSGGLAKKYAGAHHDSFIKEPSKDIYHWYADNVNDGTAVLNKNNVIFADHCWQMIRTTDTGGVKMIYNGEVVNNKCLDNRGNHEGYYGPINAVYNLKTSYWYGTDYIYDRSSKLFSIAGTTSTGEVKLGEYTCLSEVEDGTCDGIYIVDEPKSTGYYVSKLVSNSTYSQYGSIGFGENFDSPSYVGYMYNNVYPYKQKTMISKETILSSTSLETEFWYASNVDYGNLNSNSYTLIDPFQVSSTSDYSNLVGKYTFRNSTDTYTGSSVYYIVGVNGSTMYYIQLQAGHNLDYYNYTFTCGDSYVDNGDGTYTINNPVVVERKNWYNDYCGYGKYVCKNAVNATCSEVRHLSTSNAIRMEYYSPAKKYKYAKNFIWDGSKYILSNNIINFWDYRNATDMQGLENAHYTCFNASGECTTLAYVYYLKSSGDTDPYFIELKEGKSIYDAINEMLYDDNVNVKDSSIKKAVDFWFEKYLVNYSNYLEETIFCNNRNQINQDTNGWNPDGGNLATNMFFDDYNSGTNLGCLNVTDQFSIANNKAKLTYNVGLVTLAELNLFNNGVIRKTGSDYWILSPYGFIKYETYGNYLYSNGDFNNSFISYRRPGVRPVISLKPKTKYFEGDGSMEHPYRITISAS